MDKQRAPMNETFLPSPKSNRGTLRSIIANPVSASRCVSIGGNDIARFEARLAAYLRARDLCSCWSSRFSVLPDKLKLELQLAATSGLPIVNVPVLSKITAVIFPAFSSATPSRIRMPRRAAVLALAMMAAGVARPIAHGHATIKTAAAMMNPAAGPVGDMTCQRNGASTPTFIVKIFKEKKVRLVDQHSFLFLFIKMNK